MIKNYKYFILFLALLISVRSKAQLVYQEVGDLKMLAGEKTLCVKYDYSSMMMADESIEPDFLKKMKDELNAKSQGRGDTFVERWNACKKERWELKFEELFNKYEGQIELSQSNTDAKYTLIVKTLVVFPGYTSSIGIGAGVESWITCSFIIIETANPKVILSQSTIKHVRGAAYCGIDSPGYCVQEAYAKIAKAYSDYVKKNKK